MSEKEKVDKAIELYQKGEYQKAIDAFSSVLETCADNAELYNNIALCYANLKDYDKAEKNYLVSVGWNDEGIGWYSANPKDSSSIPLLREYNPNAFANNHNYTTSKPEHNWLIGLGWLDEGMAWYALS